MTMQANAAQMPMPARADEPLGGHVYYNLLPVYQADPAKPLGVVVEDDRFEDGWGLVFGASLEDGNAQFRLDSGTKGGVQLRSRNSGKLVFAANGRMIQWVRKDAESLADLELVPAGGHRYRIVRKWQPTAQWRVPGNGVPMAGATLEVAEGEGSLFYLAPATGFRWLDGGETATKPYQDATELALRAVIGGVLGFGGDKLSEMIGIPGGAMALKFAFSLIWPEKTLDQILQAFRKDLIEDMRRLAAGEATVQAANKLQDLRRELATVYRDSRRMLIDRPAGQATVQADAARLASGYGTAILGLLPGVVNADGTLAWPIASTYKSLVKAGLAVYAEGAIDHLAALQEQALMSAFDPAYVVRTYPCSADGHYLDAGRDDVVRLGAKTADRAVALSLINLEDGTLTHGDSIALNTVNGRYLTNFAGNMGPVIAIREQRGNWETFRIERVAGEGRLCSGDRVHLAGPEGWYVSAIDGPDKPLSVSLIVPGETETFIVHGVGASGALRHGQRIGLQAADGRYVSAIDGGGGNVLPSSPHLSGWETFGIERVSVGSTLHYGNKVVIRRPSDGRFASVTAGQDGHSPLLMENGRVDRRSVFTVAGGVDGGVVNPGDGFQLRTADGRHVAIDGDGVLVADATATTFRAAIVNGSPRLSASGEPADWVKAAATRYATNIGLMMAFLVEDRHKAISWRRDEVARSPGYRVVAVDSAVNRTLYLGLESNPSQFKDTEAAIDETFRQYKFNLGINDVIYRNRPMSAVRRFDQAAPATEAMYNRLRRNLGASTEFWRQSVLPDSAEWTL